MRKILVLATLAILCISFVPFVSAKEDGVKLLILTTYNGKRVSVPFALVNSNYYLDFKETNINGEGFLIVEPNETIKLFFLCEVPFTFEFELKKRPDGSYYKEYPVYVELLAKPIDLPTIKPEIFFSPLTVINLTYGEWYYDEGLQEWRIPLTLFEYKFYRAVWLIYKDTNAYNIMVHSEVYNPLAWGNTTNLTLDDFKFYNSVINKIWD
jgi:hypothetical protein